MGFNSTFIINKDTNKATLLTDLSFTVVQTGYHVFGKTGGRANQAILDISDYKNIIVKINKLNVDSANPGEIYLGFYDVIGNTTVNPITDPNIIKKILATPDEDNVNSYTLTPAQFSDLSLPDVGMVVYAPSPQVGTTLRVRILGGR